MGSNLGELTSSSARGLAVARAAVKASMGYEPILPSDLPQKEEELEEHEFVTDECTFTYGIRDDGKAVILKCDTKALALEIPAEIEGHQVGAMGKRCCSGCHKIQSIALPEGIDTICSFAFLGCDLSEFHAPASLKTIEDKTFYRCTKLQKVILNEGLVSIGDGSFNTVGLSALHLPSTLEYLGRETFVHTNLVIGGPAATLTLDPANPYLLLDGFGALYYRIEEGLVLDQMLNASVVDYVALPGTVMVEKSAFHHHKTLRSVIFQSGLRKLSDGAFKSCVHLTDVDLPESLEYVGEAVFKESSVTALHFSDNLKHLGGASLFTCDLTNADRSPSLHEITVGENNPIFYTKDGLLCRHAHEDEDGDVALLFFGTQEELRIPDEITIISASTFAGVRTLRSLTLHENIGAIGLRAMAFSVGPNVITLENSKYKGGSDTILLPGGKVGTNAVQLAFKDGRIDDYYLHQCADEAIFLCRDPFQRMLLMMKRLSDPLYLNEGHTEAFDRVLTRELGSICSLFAQHNYNKGYDHLADLGYINKDTVDTCLEAVVATDETISVSYLMDLKNNRFGDYSLDFDL